MRTILDSIRTSLSHVDVIRTSGSVELRAAEGTFSIFNSKKPFTGFAWDCLSVAAGLLDSPPGRILILGFGGGTVAGQCRRLYLNCQIDGVEVDGAIIRAARRFFDVRSTRARVIHADALAYVKQSGRARYDAVLDDIWPGRRGLQKPLFAHPEYVERVYELLRPRGVYAVNLWCGPGRSSEMQRAARLLARPDRQLYSLIPPKGPTRVLLSLGERPDSKAIARAAQLSLRLKRFRWRTA